MINRKFILVLLSSFSASFLAWCQPEEKFEVGDIIFQTSNSGQSKAIQLATNSKYSHCGVIVEVNGELLVLEAVQPVKLTNIDSWIKRGDGGKYVLRRLKDNSVITDSIKKVISVQSKKYIGKPYDIYFNWSDEEIYCSELVWKIYQSAIGVRLCSLHQLGEYNLSHPAVKQKLKERYGNNIPLTENMVSPADIFNSKLLTTVN